jgi:hypothetical protein
MTREQARREIDSLDFYMQNHTDDYGEESHTAMMMAIKALEQTRWIPVSERLPEERKKCLVAFKGGYVGIMCYAPDLYRVDEYDFCDEKGMAGWYDYDRELGHYSRDDVIAWMYLPESYKAESEDKE